MVHARLQPDELRPAHADARRDGHPWSERTARRIVGARGARLRGRPILGRPLRILDDGTGAVGPSPVRTGGQDTANVRSKMDLSAGAGFFDAPFPIEHMRRADGTVTPAPAESGSETSPTVCAGATPVTSVSPGGSGLRHAPVLADRLTPSEGGPRARLVMAINMLPSPGADALAVTWIATTILGITSNTHVRASGTGPAARPPGDLDPSDAGRPHHVAALA